MRFKTDENLPPDVKQMLEAEGHDALTVKDQRLTGLADPALIEVCRIAPLRTESPDRRLWVVEEYGVRIR